MPLNVVEIPANPAAPANLYIAWFAKHPADTATLTISVVKVLAALGRSIVGSPVITCDGLTITNVTQSQNVIIFHAAGGTDGSTYPITMLLTFDDESTFTRDIWLPVQSLFLQTQTPVIIAKGDRGLPGPPADGGTVVGDNDITVDDSSSPGSILLALGPTGVTPGTYTGSFTVDANGRITAVGGGGTQPDYFVQQDGVSRFLRSDGSGFFILDGSQ